MEPGSDSKAVTTIYSYSPSKPYNPDNDVQLRFVGNSKVKEMYLLIEDESDYNANLKKLGENGYADYVVKNGEKLSLSTDPLQGTLTAEVIKTNLLGANAITVASVSDSGKSISTTSFVGLEWEHVVNGIYQFATIADVIGSSETNVELQHCMSAGMENLYRFVNLFGPGFNLKFNILPDYTFDDGDGYGPYSFFRVPAQDTGLTYGSYGAIGVRDIGYWQGDDSFVTSGSYASYIFAEDSYASVYVQYYVSAGNLGYAPDTFIPTGE